VIEISLNDLISLCRLASLGKVIDGMLHNINGPLQNLGMDIEMMNNSLAGNRPLHDALAKDIDIRLKRMEEEFERIRHLTKIASIRASIEDDYQECMNLHDFLHHELSFLEANLYFKHNVHTELQLEDGLPQLNILPRGVPLSLSWFIHSFIEEMERQGISDMILKAGSGHSGLEISLATKGGDLSEKFIKLLDTENSSFELLRNENVEVEMILALEGLKSCGVSMRGQFEPSNSIVMLTIPLVTS